MLEEVPVFNLSSCCKCWK